MQIGSENDLFLYLLSFFLEKHGCYKKITYLCLK